jgi:hypothetical protein
MIVAIRTVRANGIRPDDRVQPLRPVQSGAAQICSSQIRTRQVGQGQVSTGKPCSGGIDIL